MNLVFAKVWASVWQIVWVDPLDQGLAQLLVL